MITSLAIGLLVFVSAFAVDMANTRYVQAVHRVAPHQAAGWSVGQWSASAVGFVIAIKFSLWMLPIEGLGLYAGAWYSLHRSKKHAEQTVNSDV